MIHITEILISLFSVYYSISFAKEKVVVVSCLHQKLDLRTENSAYTLETQPIH